MSDISQSNYSQDPDPIQDNQEVVSEQDSIISEENMNQPRASEQSDQSKQQQDQLSMQSQQLETSKLSSQQKSDRSHKKKKKHHHHHKRTSSEKRKRKKEKKRKKKEKKRRKEKRKKRRRSSASESSSEQKEDSNIDYGSPERITDGSSFWDGKSDQLYDSDDPEKQINLYHENAKPRILEIQDMNEIGQLVRLQLDFMEIEEKQQILKFKDKTTYHAKKKEQEFQLNYIDHYEYQKKEQFGKVKPIILHNMISDDFIRGCLKNLSCPICQDQLKNPVIYKICLHRFCNNCIEAYNRQGKRECPLCRKFISNRRQLRQDKNIAALINQMEFSFKRLNKQEELDNQEIKRKLIQEQKLLLVQKKKQKQVIEREFRRKYGDQFAKKLYPEQENTQQQQEQQIEQSQPNQQQPKKKNTRGSAGFGGQDGGIDTNHVIKLIEEKKANLPNLLKAIDIEIIINHDREQSLTQSMLVKSIRLKTNREISLIHLAILIAHKNKNREEEWPNYEFYRAEQNLLIKPEVGEQKSKREYIKPFRFKMKIYEILRQLYPNGEDINVFVLELVYKKKQLPIMNPKLAQNNLKVQLENDSQFQQSMMMYNNSYIKNEQESYFTSNSMFY